MQRFFSKGYIYVFCVILYSTVLLQYLNTNGYMYPCILFLEKKARSTFFQFFSFFGLSQGTLSLSLEKKVLRCIFLILFTIASSSCTHTKLFFSDTVRITSSGFQLLHEHKGLIMSPKGLPASSLSKKHTSSVFFFIILDHSLISQIGSLFNF